MAKLTIDYLEEGFFHRKETQDFYMLLFHNVRGSMISPKILIAGDSHGVTKLVRYSIPVCFPPWLAQVGVNLETSKRGTHFDLRTTAIEIWYPNQATIEASSKGCSLP